MNGTITITEVLGRAEQGMTKPFLCVAEFAEYYVKGAYAGKNSLCCEWVANRLVNLALPSAPLGVPMFRMGEVPLALIEGSGRADIRDLGAGRVFASLRIDDGQELTWSTAQGWRREFACATGHETGILRLGVALHRSRNFLETAMNPTQTACNYALLRFVPYPQTGEVVNVGVVVNCLQPCFLHFLAEERMPDRVKALFPRQDEGVYQAALAAVKQDVERINARIREQGEAISDRLDHEGAMGKRFGSVHGLSMGIGGRVPPLHGE